MLRRGIRLRNTGIALAVLGALSVARLTLYPTPWNAAASLGTPLTCLVCGERGGVDVVLNLLLFIPFGLGLGLAGCPARRTLLLAAAFSFSIEGLQYVAIPGRDASLSDLITNSAGALTGTAIAPLLPGAVFPTMPVARRLLAAGLAIWVGLLGLSAWLQQPASTGGRLTSQWARASIPQVFDGVVTAVSLNARPMEASGPVADSGRIRSWLEAGDVALEVAARSGSPTVFPAWLYELRAGSTEQLVLSQDGRRAVIAVPGRALRYRLNPPTLSVADGFPATAGVPVTVAAGRAHGRLLLRSSYAGRTRAARLDLSPAHGWGLIAPFGYTLGPGVRLITGLVLVGLVLPLGYWSSASGRPAAGAALLALGLAAGLGGVPRVAGYAPVHWSEWLAAGLGAAAGWALHRFAAYLQPRCGSPSASESF